MKEILSIRYPLVYPSDVLEPLATAITVTTLKAISISANELKLFKAYWPNDKSIAGTCWAFKVDSIYYVYFVGTKVVLAVNSDEFIFEETNEIWAAAQIKDGDAVVLVCTYNDQSDYYEIKAKELIKVTFPDFRKIETIHTFEENYSFDQGLDYFYSNFEKKQNTP